LRLSFRIPITGEMGKPLADSIGEVKKAGLNARHFAA
jgi:hypothetical protein